MVVKTFITFNTRRRRPTFLKLKRKKKKLPSTDILTSQVSYIRIISKAKMNTE